MVLLMDIMKGRSLKKICWCNNCGKAFNTLKNGLYNKPVLFNLDFSKIHFADKHLRCRPGFCTSQEVNSEEHCILYLNRNLIPREKTYSMIEKEAPAVIWVIVHRVPFGIISFSSLWTPLVSKNNY